MLPLFAYDEKYKQCKFLNLSLWNFDIYRFFLLSCHLHENNLVSVSLVPSPIFSFHLLSNKSPSRFFKLNLLFIYFFFYFFFPFQISASSGQTNGLSSSLVFTPVQGLELVNPNAAAERVKAANNKWFNANSGFMSAAPSMINNNKMLG